MRDVAVEGEGAGEVCALLDSEGSEGGVGERVVCCGEVVVALCMLWIVSALEEGIWS